MDIETPTVEKAGKNKGGRPPKDFTKTAEFHDAVAVATQRAVAAALDDIVPRLAASVAVSKGAEVVDEGHVGLARQLAMSIAEVADQGTNRKRVSPEVLAKREQHRVRMFELLLRYRAEGRTMDYRVVRETYLNETLVRPFRTDSASKSIVPQDISWTGVPNDCMRPLNQNAQDVFDEFMGWMGDPALAAKPNNDGLTVTQNGLVVKGLTASRRPIGNLQDTVPSPGKSPFEAALSVNAPNDPRATEVRVLGTIAPPARQNFAGEHRA